MPLAELTLCAEDSHWWMPQRKPASSPNYRMLRSVRTEAMRDNPDIRREHATRIPDPKPPLQGLAPVQSPPAVRDFERQTKRRFLCGF